MKKPRSQRKREANERAIEAEVQRRMKAAGGFTDWPSVKSHFNPSLAAPDCLRRPRRGETDLRPLASLFSLGQGGARPALRFFYFVFSSPTSFFFSSVGAQLPPWRSYLNCVLTSLVFLPQRRWLFFLPYLRCQKSRPCLPGGRRSTRPSTQTIACFTEKPSCLPHPQTADVMWQTSFWRGSGPGLCWSTARRV